jgi:NAD(P)H-flavin reductase
LPARICRITQETADTATYELQFENAASAAPFRFQPGQFNMLYLPGFGESAISISSDAERPESIAHTVRVVGNVTRALARRRVGEEVLVRGPFGSPWPIAECAGRDVIIAAGGIGLAPLRPVIYHLINHRDDFGEVHLLYGARSPQGLLYRNEFEGWHRAGIHIEVTVDAGDPSWQGHIGVVPMLLQRLRVDAANTRVLTCGPEIMMRFVILVLCHSLIFG